MEFIQSVLMTFIDGLEKSSFAVGHLGVIVVAFYFTIFLGIAFFRGKLKIERSPDGTYRLSQLKKPLLSALLIPLVVTAAGLMVSLGVPRDCIHSVGWDGYRDGDDFLDVSAACPAIVTYDAPSNVNWMGSEYNAFGAVVLTAQKPVVGLLMVGAVAGVLGLGLKLLAVIVLFGVAILTPPAKFIRGLAQKIPIRW